MYLIPYHHQAYGMYYADMEENYTLIFEKLSTTTASACCYISHTENILYAALFSTDTSVSFTEEYRSLYSPLRGLHIACCMKWLNIIKLLLEKRCNTNIPNKKGETARDIALNEDGDCLLHIACQWGEEGIVRYLITDERCNPNVQSFTSKNTPLDTMGKMI